MKFELAQAFTSKWEGGLTDHPSDPGGITKYGVSLRWLKDLPLELGDIDGDTDIDADDIRKLSKEDAARLFKLKFWDNQELDTISLFPAICHYDCSINCGIKQATLITQRASNSLACDGVFGNNTKKFLNESRPLQTSMSMLNERRKFYENLVNSKSSLKPFLKGWINRCNDLDKYIQTLITNG